MNRFTFEKFENLSDWEDDTIVVVHVLPCLTARVRSHVPNRISDEMPLPAAIEEANRFVQQGLGLSSVAVYLGHDAVWDDRYGSLVPWVPS